MVSKSEESKEIQSKYLQFIKMWKVPLFDLNYDEQESRAVQKVLDSKWLTMGHNTAAFEEQFGKMLGSGEATCSLVCNCTSALYMSLLALGLQPEDEVIIPALTFVADINAVLMTGAKPILADCESFSEWNMTAETIRPHITTKTKAVIIVHFAGFPCEMDAILDLCKERNIALIEDVAHAPGATYKGQKCGTFGTFSCFSFFTNKNLSVGEGGMLVTQSKQLHEKIRHLRSHGMSSLTLDRHKGRTISYDVLCPGLNFRSDEMHAALGIEQLAKLEKSNLRRKELSIYYREKLQDVSEITIPFRLREDVDATFHIFPILLAAHIDRLEVINSLKEAGIQSSIHYPAMQQFSGFEECGLNASPKAEAIAERELTLPLFPTMTFEQIDRVVEHLKKALKS